MTIGKLVGAAQAAAMLDRLPDAAREQLGVELAILAQAVLAAERADVAVNTGALSSDLAIQLNLAALRVRIGLFAGGRDAYRFNGKSRGAVAGGPFYAIFVEFGRAAQTVAVTRHLDVIRRIGNNRKGNTRRTVYAGKPYLMRVSALPARPFINNQESLVESLVDQRFTDFWNTVLARAGGSA